ncbi:hypothetical protein ACH4GK_33595 [Streptomyces rimosus]|nr:hypothetical protein [Streptomyces rimosus]
MDDGVEPVAGLDGRVFAFLFVGGALFLDDLALGVAVGVQALLVA